MNFLLIASFPGSILEFRGQLIADLQRVGWRVHVVAPSLSVGDTTRSDLEARGVVVHTVPLMRTGTNPLKDLAYGVKLLRLMLAIRPDVVLAYTIKPIVYGMVVATLAGVPRRFALITGLGYAFTGESKATIGRLIRFVYWVALRCSSKVFFQNVDDAALFRQLGILGLRTPNVVLNGSGVDLLKYTPAPLPSGPLSFLMIARLLGNKGVREYAAAAAAVKSQDPRIAFRLVGWMDDNPDSISSSELGDWIESQVIEFVGPLQDVRPEIARSTVYVLPSYREGTPRTVLEAMAMARPVITCDVPGCRATVSDGVNGFLVRSRSSESLLVAMQRFIENPELASRMGRQSRLLAEQKYDSREVSAVMIAEMGCASPGSPFS
jgi:glycosyltransferase involved in cell wall biosynthesis